MSKINFQPDENGVPMCNRKCPYMSNAGDQDSFEPECTHPTMDALIYDLESSPMLCYPQIAKITKALDRISKMSGIMVSEHARKIALEALKHE